MSDLLTLFVDSSLCLQTHAGGWGAWAIRDDWKGGWTFGGMFGRSVSPHSSREAELCGIANALAVLSKFGQIDDVKRVQIQCDCLQALEMIAGKIGNVTVSDHPDGHPITPGIALHPTELETAALVAIEKATGKPLLVRHVYGHRKGEKRQWVNRKCDAVAKRHMRAARALRVEVVE